LCLNGRHERGRFRVRTAKLSVEADTPRNKALGGKGVPRAWPRGSFALSIADEARARPARLARKAKV
jgi:hypothetical protein